MQGTSSVADWMKLNRLQLNVDKTEVMWCSTCRRQYQFPSSPMNVDGVSGVPVQSVRELSIYIDVDLVMRTRGIEVLRGASTSTPNPSLRTGRNLADTRGRFGIVMTGLRKCRVSRPSSLPDSSSSVCHERLSTDDPSTTQLRPHNRRTGQSPLASHPRAHSIQGRSTKCFMDSRTYISDH